MSSNCPDRDDASSAKSQSTASKRVAPARPFCRPDGATAIGRAEAVALLEDIRIAMDENPATARTAALRLVALLTPPDPPASPNARGGLSSWQKSKIERYLRNHLADTMRLSELANEASLSVSHFCRAFKRSFGETPHIHIIRLRLELAQNLMLTTDLPLSQVALSCGLADQAHLTKLFRRWLADTPSVWRRRNLGEDHTDTTNGRSVS